MSLNRLFEAMDEARSTANCKTVFGEPQVVEGRTVIPVAKVAYGFGLGFGQGVEADEEAIAKPGEGGGGGAGAMTTPLGMVVVTPERVTFEPVVDWNKVNLAATGVAGLLVLQIARTLRVIFARD